MLQHSLLHRNLRESQMGDCRIRLQISKQVFPDSREDWHIVIRFFAADTTIGDVVQELLLPILRVSNIPESISIWDCTLHPPKEITEWPTRQYPANSGPYSKTLYDSGCFPSGSWHVLPRGSKPKILSISEDTQYNVEEKLASVAMMSKVNFLDPSQELMKPSQILQSVKERFDSDPEFNVAAAMEAQSESKSDRARKEAAKHARLEAQIAKLNTSKQSNVSLQVRKMLIKSRCTGLKTLEMQDRVHLHIISANGEATAEYYRYFSTQDTVARILSTMSPNVDSELLIKLNGEFRRLPVVMRLYEAIADSYLKKLIPSSFGSTLKTKCHRLVCSIEVFTAMLSRLLKIPQATIRRIKAQLIRPMKSLSQRQFLLMTLHYSNPFSPANMTTNPLKRSHQGHRRRYKNCSWKAKRKVTKNVLPRWKIVFLLKFYKWWVHSLFHESEGYCWPFASWWSPHDEWQ